MSRSAAAPIRATILAPTAEKYAAQFLIATECGFGRRAPETIAELLRIHAEVAAG